MPIGFEILAESKQYVLGHIHEEGYIIKKDTGEMPVYIGACYGNPETGLIDKNEKWALLLGHVSYLWMPGQVINLNEEVKNHNEIFKWPFDVKQMDDFWVEVLDDPWGENPGIYSLEIDTLYVKRIRDFQKLDTPYNDNNVEINW